MSNTKDLDPIIFKHCIIWNLELQDYFKLTSPWSDEDLHSTTHFRIKRRFDNEKERDEHFSVLKRMFTRDELLKIAQDCMVIGVKSQREGTDFNEGFIDYVEKNNL